MCQSTKLIVIAYMEKIINKNRYKTKTDMSYRVIMSLSTFQTVNNEEKRLSIFHKNNNQKKKKNSLQIM